MDKYKIGKGMNSKKTIAIVLGFALSVPGQVPTPPPGFPVQTPAQPTPAPKPQTTPQTTTPQTGAPQSVLPQTAATAPAPMGNMNLENASLSQVIDSLAQKLKLNIIVDPSVKGSVTLNTYGDTTNIDARNLLDLILRINGFGLVKDGELYRVIPLKSITHMPLHPEINQKNIPEDEQTILNLVFLKYVSVEELIKVLSEFKGENSDMIGYGPANLLFLLDSRRNMRRTMELIAQFDSDLFANQRVRLFEVKNVKPSEVVKDLDSIFKSISLDSKTSTVRFIGVDRINTLIAVAPNPGVFDNVADWLEKLDIPIKITAGTIDNYVYKVYYGRAECLSQALNQLFNPGLATGGSANTFGGFGNNGGGNNGYTNNGGNNGYANNGTGGYGNNGGYGGGGGGMGNAGGYGNQNSFSSGFGGSGGCGANGMSGGGAYAAGQAYGYPTLGGYAAQAPAANATGLVVGSAAGAATPGAAAPAAPRAIPPRIIANPLDNKLLIQADAQQYQNILKILKELDVPPRQILLEAKIYYVTLTDSLTSDITANLAKAGGGLGAHQLLGNLASSGSVGLTAGTIVGQSRQLLLTLSANENRQYSKLLSEPSLIATDSIPASINVGTQVPVSTGTTVIPSGGTATTSQSYSSETTGITLQVNARVNSSGVVTLVINQEISNVDPSTPLATTSTPAFDQQVIQTQITMMDGDTIAIGGLISEQTANNTNGIPGLIRIPWIGWLFGSKSISKERSELIMFFTPHVIFDETQLIEASDELKTRVKILKRDIRRL
jgi:general secretion pathway protein D